MIEQASEQFVNNIADHLRDRLNQDISKSEFIASLKSTIEEDIMSRIDNRNSLERHERRPNIPIGPLAGRIEEDVAQRVQHFIQAKEAALRTRIDALHLRGAARRAAVQRAVNAAKARIANQLASTAGQEAWVKLSRETITGSIPMSDCAADTILIKRFTLPYAARSEDSELVLT